METLLSFQWQGNVVLDTCPFTFTIANIGRKYLPVSVVIKSMQTGKYFRPMLAMDKGKRAWVHCPVTTLPSPLKGQGPVGLGRRIKT
jgi:hypothetical protein